MTGTSDGTYGAASLTVLKGLEAVRKRPGMYIGDNNSRGLTHLVYEILDNAVDEALAGHCSQITVTLHSDGSVQVADDGRGIPVDIEPKSGLPGVVVVLTELHAGGKFGGSGYAVAGGLHGVGASVVNAMSSRLDVEVDRGGTTHLISFQAGIPGRFDTEGNFTAGNGLRTSGQLARSTTGTRIRYWPDRSLFHAEATMDVEAITARVRQTAFLVPNLTIHLHNNTGAEPVRETFHFAGGVTDLVTFRSSDAPLPAAPEPLTIVGSGRFTERVPVEVDGLQVISDVDRECGVEIALRWGTGYECDVVSFVNIVHTPKGGTHLDGFEQALLKVINEQLKAQRIAKAKDAPVTKDDIREGLTAVVVVKLSEPQFGGQTKDELNTPPVKAIVAATVSENLTQWLTKPKNKIAAKAVLEKIQHASRARLAARDHRAAQRRKTALEHSSMPTKLTDCRSEDIEKTELYIVEGDSALGTFKAGRDSEFQAALPVRGKILNVQSIGQSKMLSNEECAAIIRVMGAGFGASFDINNVRYGKLIALCDADIDGAHIRTLLLTFCFRYMRPLLEAGRVYSAVPPLHRLDVVFPKKEYIYTYSDDELRETLSRLEREGKRLREGEGVQRYKGLGEMDADQLAETTLDPAHRRLRRMTMHDAEAASHAFEMCMGNDPGPRRSFIMTEGGLLDEALIDA